MNFLLQDHAATKTMINPKKKSLEGIKVCGKERHASIVSVVNSSGMNSVIAMGG